MPGGHALDVGASLMPLIDRLVRRPLALLAVAGVIGAAVVALWLLAPSPSDEVVVEVAVPPRVAEEDNLPPPEPSAAATDPAAARPGAGNALAVPPVAADAFDRIPAPARVAGLPPAPDPAFVEAAAEGPLPKRAADGRMPWQGYARPFEAAGDRPRVAVVVIGLGRSAIVNREIIQRLPADVTLAFEPMEGAAGWARRARAAGHEIMLSLPVQGSAFPFVDRGPEALTSEAKPAEIRAGLLRLLARMAGYVGAFANVGAEGAAGGDAVASPALDIAGRELAERGLLLVSPFLDKAWGGDAPQLGVDVAIGPDADIVGARARLAELEAAATAKGHALAVVEPTPASAEALAEWAATLSNRRMVLAPVSAVAQAVQANAR